MTQMYDWGVFWEDGNKASLPVPFGPEGIGKDTVIDLDSPWVEKILEYIPNFVTAMEELPFAFIIVNPPRDAYQSEISEWTVRGYEF